MVGQDLQYLSQVLKVVGEGLAINQNIVKEDDYKFLQIRPQGLIHSGLKGSWGVTQAERHHEEFIMPVMRSEGCLAYILRRH